MYLYTVAKYRKYSLWTGHIIKSMGCLTKGQSTNVSELSYSIGWSIGLHSK